MPAAPGLPAAIRARDLGASVIVVDQNFDIGGKMLHSGGQISLGGGDPLQLRDIKGESDREGFVTAPRRHSVEELTEDPDFLFRDHTDWSVMDSAAQAPYRYNERDLHRAYADNCYATREFLMANYVRMGRISGTHGNGGMSRARRAVSFLMEGPTTDIKKGTVSARDAGIAGVSSSHFAPRLMDDGTNVASKGARANGAALSRGLEFSAREKGVRFILNRHMDEIIREQQFSGRVIGIRASYSPRFDPVRPVRVWRASGRTATSTTAPRRSTSGPARPSSSVPVDTGPIRSSAACSTRRCGSRRSCRAAGRCSDPAARTRAASSPA